MKKFILVFLFCLTCGISIVAQTVAERADSIVASICEPSIPTAVVLFPESAKQLPPVELRLELQAAIDSLSQAGGGKLILSSGTYNVCGSIVLRSRICLHLSQGAELLFCGHPSCFLPPVLTRFEGTDLYGRQPMLRAEGATDIAVTGTGIIKANGRVMSRWGMTADTNRFAENIHGTHGETVEMADVRRLRQMGNNGIPLSERIFADSTFLRPCAIEFRNCSRVLVQDVTVKNSPFWCIHPLYSDNVIVRSVTIDSHFPNNDGCDPESSRNVLIENCTFRTGDDAVAIKSGRDADGRRVGRPSENIVIRHCRFFSECNGLCIGSEMSGGVHDVIMHNVTIGDVKNALLFKSNLDRGGYIRDVWVDSISIASAKGAVLRFETNYFGYSGGNYPAQYERFHISHVNAGKADAYAIYYDGPADASEGTPVGLNPDYAIRDIDVHDFHVRSARHACYLYNVKRCSFTRCSVNGIYLNPHPEQSLERQSCDVW